LGQACLVRHRNWRDDYLSFHRPVEAFYDFSVLSARKRRISPDDYQQNSDYFVRYARNSRKTLNAKALQARIAPPNVVAGNWATSLEGDLRSVGFFDPAGKVFRIGAIPHA